RCFFMAAQG
ncbi:chromosomal replication initiator protein, partial [Helicobacter pylori]